MLGHSGDAVVGPESKTDTRPVEAVTLDDRSELDGQGSDISAVEVYHLLLGTGLAQKPNKLTLRNARIVGDLDLESAELDIAAEFRQCTFTRMINLEQAKAKALYFVECGLRGISAGQLRTTFGFVVQNCVDTGGINLSGAHVGGQVSFAETRLNPSDGDPLIADGLVVDQDMRCTDGFLANGKVRLVGAHIGGQFQCEDGTFRNPGQVALEASGLIVDEGVYWRRGFRVDGAIRLLGAHIKGELRCEGGRFDDGDIALDFPGLTVDRDVTFTTGSVVNGGINLTGSQIGGNLDLTGGSFHHAGTALDLARVSIAQNLICRTGFEVQGKVLLAGATIGGNLWCEGGTFDNATGAAIDARGLTVGRDVAFCRSAADEGFSAKGKVVLSDASIGGSLNCAGGRFISSGDLALTAKGLSVTRDAVFGAGFSTDGEVDIADATIGGNLTCGGGRFSHRPMSFKADRIQIKQSAQFGDGFHAEGTVSLRSAQIGADVEFAKATLAAREQETALTLSGATVGATLRLRFSAPPTGTVDLSAAKVGQLDDRETLWPLAVRLDDFVYGTLPADGPGVRTRLAWLDSNPGYVPQIYLQLASVYRAAGSVDESIAVAVAGEDARWATQSNRFKRIFGLLLRITVLYGYRPLMMLWYLIGLEAVGIAVFTRLHAIGAIKPTGNIADFNPFLYTLDLLVPVVSLGQRNFWVPTGVAVWVSSAFTVIGWILALCLAVGVGRIFKTQ
jgi:hypothetical protein